MFPDDELLRIQEDLNTTLPDSCNILAGTRTSDSMGGWTESWATAYATISCRLDFTGGREGVTAGALIPYSGAILTLPASTVITTENRIEHAGNTYTVQAVNLGSWLGVKRVSVQKV